ncbi:MAG: histidine kinase, partial [Chitinophagaceae bacterium]
GLVAVTDSLNNAFTVSLSDIETKYEVQKKENVIMRQQFDLTAKNYLLFGSLLLLLVVIVAAYFIFRATRSRHLMKMQVMRDEEKRIAVQAVEEAEEAERKRIAADLHDNLGAQANAILYSTELLQHEQAEKEILLNDLHDTARGMLASLRETLWALKNTTVNAPDVWLRLINFTKQLGRHYTSVKISAEGMAPACRLSSAKALNIVFIMQEAMNNAVRHSGAESIYISSEYADTVWKLEVKDNGTGFDRNSANKKPESYGLSNMTERAVAAEAVINIETSATAGTKVELKVRIGN